MTFSYILIPELGVFIVFHDALVKILGWRLCASQSLFPFACGKENPSLFKTTFFKNFAE